MAADPLGLLSKRTDPPPAQPTTILQDRVEDEYVGKLSSSREASSKPEKGRRVHSVHSKQPEVYVG